MACMTVRPSFCDPLYAVVGILHRPHPSRGVLVWESSHRLYDRAHHVVCPEHLPLYSPDQDDTVRLLWRAPEYEPREPEEMGLPNLPGLLH